MEERVKNSEKEKFLKKLMEEVNSCKRCPLHKTRKRVVFGDGNPLSLFAIVGEAPGREEDERGIPFVGRAGKLLRKLLEETELDGRVYILNVVKCRPPHNRKPYKKEMETCRTFLERQLRILAPRVILALGSTATEALTGRNSKMTEIRGKPIKVEDFILVPSYHPSFILRNPGASHLLLEDIERAKSFLKN